MGSELVFRIKPKNVDEKIQLRFFFFETLIYDYPDQSIVEKIIPEKKVLTWLAFN